MVDMPKDFPDRTIFRLMGGDLEDRIYDLFERFYASISGSLGGTSKTFTVVSITVATGASQGSSQANADLVGGTVIGAYPTGITDESLKGVVLNGDGSVTITLLSNGTGSNSYDIVVMK